MSNLVVNVGHLKIQNRLLSSIRSDVELSGQEPEQLDGLINFLEKLCSELELSTEIVIEKWVGCDNEL